MYFLKSDPRIPGHVASPQQQARSCAGARQSTASTLLTWPWLLLTIMNRVVCAGALLLAFIGVGFAHRSLPSGVTCDQFSSPETALVIPDPKASSLPVLSTPVVPEGGPPRPPCCGTEMSVLHISCIQAIRAKTCMSTCVETCVFTCTRPLQRSR